MARLNVAYIPPDTGDKGRSDPEWIVRLQFLDAMGQVVAERIVRLMPGHAENLDLAFDSRVAGRQQIRGLIIDNAVENPTRNKGTLLGTVEVFDSETGQTQFILPGTTAGGPSPHM